MLRRAAAAGVPARAIGRTGGSRLSIAVDGEPAIDVAVASRANLATALERFFERPLADQRAASHEDSHRWPNRQLLDKFKDECGVFGIFGHPEAANLTYLGLYALQHRGQESAGIAPSDGG